jgi:twitching motility protein PilI
MAEQRSPLECLALMEQQCLTHARTLPQKHRIEYEWSGIGFRLGDLRLVASIEEVAEILTPPPLSVVPRTKSWVCGIANVRGNLLPIMDLGGFISDVPANLTRRSRILVVSQNDLYAGLAVDAVLGLRHFRPEHRCDAPPADDPRMRAYLKHGFRSGDELWGVFSLRDLTQAPLFLQVAV